MDRAIRKRMKKDLLAEMRAGEELPLSRLLRLAVQLSVPAIMAQAASIIMQYIDASMVGRLGAVDSAGIGLIAATTWLIGGLCNALSTGFTVQVAHRIGAGDEAGARNVVKHGLIFVLLMGALIGGLAFAISDPLPRWLGGEPDVCLSAARYFRVDALAIPAMQMVYLAGGMLQCSGNMKVPSALNIVMCVLDVIFNSLLIFPTRVVRILGLSFTYPGAGLGVTGAALGTALAKVLCGTMMLCFMLGFSKPLRIRRGERLPYSPGILGTGIRLAIPVAFESAVMGGAQVVSTRIVAPLGTIAIAANSFSITAESLCYMPGYGISSAATTLVGQSVGAGRLRLTRRLAWITTLLGMIVMGAAAVLMYVFAPWMIGIMSPDSAIRALGTRILRIEAFAEPLFGAEIVAGGCLRGAGDTMSPSIMNFISMWGVRLPLAAFLAPRYGLEGVWIAMALELSLRGTMFLIRLALKKWTRALPASRDKPS